MDAILQVLREAVTPVNLPFTALMGLVLGYWLLVMIGCLSADHGDASVDLEAGGTDLHVEGTDAGLDLDGASTDVDLHHGHGNLHGSHLEGGLHVFQPLLRFLHAGDIPLVPLLSLFAFFLWLQSLLYNHYFNSGGHWGLGLLLVLPNLVITAVLIHYLARPLKHLFRAMNQDASQSKPIVGAICTVTTGEVTPQFGQGIIETKGAPLLLHIRTTGDEVLRRGESAIVIAQSKDKGIYQVTRFQQLKLEN